MTLDLRVYLVTDPGMGGNRPLTHTVEEAVAGGVTLVQLRDKGADPAELERQARELQEVLRGTGVDLVVNDSLPVAVAVGAGLHVGARDAGPAQARAALGSTAAIGTSLGSGRPLGDEDLAALDYVAVGPVWDTATKADAGPATGLSPIPSAAAYGLPVVAIGGIDAARAGEAVRAGAAGVAVVSAVMASNDPRAAARALREAVDEALAERAADRFRP